MSRFFFGWRFYRVDFIASVVGEMMMGVGRVGGRRTRGVCIEYSAEIGRYECARDRS